MTIKVNIAGTEVPVTLTDEQIKDIRHSADVEFAQDIIRQYISRAQEILDVELDFSEEEEVLEGNPFPEHQTKEEFIADIISGALLTSVKQSVQDVVRNRKEFFEVTIKATQEFSIWVKASDAHEAEEYAENLEYHELADYLNDYDHDFEVSEVSSTGVDDIGSDDFFDTDDV